MSRPDPGEGQARPGGQSWVRQGPWADAGLAMPCVVLSASVLAFCLTPAPAVAIPVAVIAAVLGWHELVRSRLSRLIWLRMLAAILATLSLLWVTGFWLLLAPPGS